MKQRSHPSLYLVTFGFAVISLGSLSGCIAQRLSSAARVSETLKPEAILVGADGTVGIKLTASFSRLRVLKEGARTPVTKYEPRLRYLLVRPASIQSWIDRQQAQDERTTGTLRKGPMIVQVWDLPAVKSSPLPDEPERVIPPGLLDPSATEDQLPSVLRGTDVKSYETTMKVPYPVGSKGRDVSLDFSNLRVGSGRQVDGEGGWREAAIIPTAIVEAPVELAGGAVLMVLAIPAIGLFWLVMLFFALLGFEMKM